MENDETHGFLFLRTIEHRSERRASWRWRLPLSRLSALCPLCGTTVFHAEEGRERSVSVAVGAFADPDFPAPQVSVYDCRRHAWVQMSADAVVFERDPD